MADFLLGHASWTFQLLFDLNGESNIPTWFSSAQLFTIGIIFFTTARDLKATHMHFRWLLTLLALGFIYLSMDETAMIHERLSAALKNFHVSWRFSGGGNGIWIIFYFSLGIIFILTFKQTLAFFYQLLKDQFPFLGLGIILYLSGAVGFEIFNNQAILMDEKNLLYHIAVSVEEFLEMLGASFILCGSLLVTRKLRNNLNEKNSFHC